MRHLLVIALGGSLGATVRYLVAKNIQGISNHLFPLGTLFVNATGSFVIGFLFYFFENTIISNDIKSFLTIGFLGAYTTFSTYSLETVNLLRDGEIKMGIINLVASNVLCLVMVIVGMVCSRILFRIIR
jgi:fluoride exporter